LIDRTVNRLVEVLWRNEVGGALESLVVDQDGTKQRLFCVYVLWNWWWRSWVWREHGYCIPKADMYMSSRASCSARSFGSIARIFSILLMIATSNPLALASAFTSLMSDAIAAFSSAKRSIRSRKE